MANEYGIDEEQVVEELGERVRAAQNFMVAEFSQDWETGEAYFNGKCDLPSEEGRSQVVKTEVRDAIRAIMPNVMRILLQSRKPVEYIPSSVMSAAFAEQQSLWINHAFLSQDGYSHIYNAALESLKLKAGPIKVLWEENPHPEHIYATGISQEQVFLYEDDPDIVVDSVEENESPTGGIEPTYDVRATRYYNNGRITYESFPIYEFFVERNASDLRSSVHGHRRSVTVSEALEMGIEYDDWRELDDDDPRANDAAAADQQRRGYQINRNDDYDTDIMNHRFLLSEVYCEYDMDGDGVPEKYVFYLGGTTYEYLHHEQIEDFCIALVCADPIPFSVLGHSVVDVTKQSQDVETSILRAIVDNAHLANNPRPAADPTKTNFNDLMNNNLSAPIRTRGSPDIQYTDVPFTAQGLMPFLEYLEKDAENRIGVTKAAQGLDPDAMQSTDKQAVMNTIQLSQGQIELMVRNIINTGLIPLFRMSLRLASRHMDRRQVLPYKGAVVPVDISTFDPDLVAVPRLGIGTASTEQRLATLQFIYHEQKQYMSQFGMDNPFTSLSQVYNTIEDMVELGGITNVGRYFTYIDREAESTIAKQFAEHAQMQAEEQKKMAPLDPGKALVMSEHAKAQVRQMEIFNKRAIDELQLQYQALHDAEQMDFERDKTAQERVIELARIGKERLNDEITNEQNSSKPDTPQFRSARGSLSWQSASAHDVVSTLPARATRKIGMGLTI